MEFVYLVSARTSADSYHRQLGSGLGCYVPRCCWCDVSRPLLHPFVDLVYDTTDVDLHPVLDYGSDDDNEDDDHDDDDNDDDGFFPLPTLLQATHAARTRVKTRACV